LKPLSKLPAERAASLEGLLFDLDDTVLSHGLLTREAFGALWDLHEAGLFLVAVTGRPSAWGEVIARQWPIDGAVTENGAVHVVREGKGVHVLFDGEEDEVRSRRDALDELVATVARELPHVRLADDSHGRRADVAWDIAERVTLPDADVAALDRIARARGARTTRSTVHLHATYERDDKASGVVRFLRLRRGIDVGAALHRYAFVGDSANDAACFSAFATTFGVANVRAFADKLSVPPRWIAPSERGAGFAEVARRILESRGAR
jgi:HAD superfamily hydrolase (TIGR01484 family)